jgi:hypothetical protein
LGGTAMGLAMHDQRVDAAPDIVDDGIAGDVDPAGFKTPLRLQHLSAILAKHNECHAFPKRIG